MSKIITVDLSEGQIGENEYTFGPGRDYGRGLAMRLLKEHVPDSCGRLDAENAVIYTPGLFTGNMAPSATRGLIMSKGEGKKGLCVSSITGDFPQKLASLDIASIVVTGKYEKRNAVIFVDPNGAELMCMPELEGHTTAEMVDMLRKQFGEDCAIIGTGQAADRMMPLASIFVTYPEGQPRFYCPRSGVGDIPGSKGLRAVVLKAQTYFGSPCVNKEAFRDTGKRLAKIIMDNEICGGALPGLGSITLIHLLKSRQAVPKVEKKSREGAEAAEKQGGCRTNYCCAPMCVIGCLNRHSAGTGEVFSAPEESEVRAALTQCFGFKEAAFAKELNRHGFSIGLNTTEFVYTVSMYWKATGETATREKVLSMMEEVEKGSVLGRLIGGGTAGVAELFKDRPDVAALVTKPSVVQEVQFKVHLDKLYPELQDMDDMELLYRQVFVLENLGFCIFSSFALLNNREVLELLAQMASDKFGVRVTAQELLSYAGDCIEQETAYQRERLAESVQKNIPEFIKVLYRYFSE